MKKRAEGLTHQLFPPYGGAAGKDPGYRMGPQLEKILDGEGFEQLAKILDGEGFEKLGFGHDLIFHSKRHRKENL